MRGPGKHFHGGHADPKTGKPPRTAGHRERINTAKVPACFLRIESIDLSNRRLWVWADLSVHSAVRCSPSSNARLPDIVEVSLRDFSLLNSEASSERNVGLLAFRRPHNRDHKV